MIVLTGDIHQQSLRNSEHSLGYNKEHPYAKKYLEITKKYKIKTTLYVTGREILDHQKFWEKTSKRKDVLLAGHTFDAFQTKNMSRIMGRILWKNNYLEWQKKDLEKAKQAFRTINIELRHWRGHNYVHYDEKMLRSCGITTSSDYQMYDAYEPKITKSGKLLQVPITVMPDHENFNHGAIDWKFLDINSWCEIIMERTEYLEKKKLPSILLIHPTCMRIADNFKTFNKICKELGRYEPGFISEVKKFLSKQSHML